MNDKERYERLKKEGICVTCKTAKAEEGYVSCKACREKSRKNSNNRRQWYKLNGICPDCGTEKLIGDEKICPECGAKKYISNLKSKKPYSREYYRKRIDGLKKKGICTQCGKRKAETGKTMCGICLEKKKIKARKDRDCLPRHERPAYGMCYCCGVLIPDGKLCGKCKERVIKNLPTHNPNEYWRSQNELLFRRKERA